MRRHRADGLFDRVAAFDALCAAGVAGGGGEADAAGPDGVPRLERELQRAGTVAAGRLRFVQGARPETLADLGGAVPRPGGASCRPHGHRAAGRSAALSTTPTPTGFERSPLMSMMSTRPRWVPPVERKSTSTQTLRIGWLPTIPDAIAQLEMLDHPVVTRQDRSGDASRASRTVCRSAGRAVHGSTSTPRERQRRRRARCAGAAAGRKPPDTTRLVIGGGEMGAVAAPERTPSP